MASVKPIIGLLENLDCQVACSFCFINNVPLVKLPNGDFICKYCLNRCVVAIYSVELGRLPKWKGSEVDKPS